MNQANIVSTFISKTNYHPTWEALLTRGLQAMDASYLQSLLDTPRWLPGIAKIFNAFSFPKNSVKYILLGESPYPRAQSANGYAFWDQSVTDLWSPTGLSKPVNRATSLRNFIKMLLVASGDLSIDNTQPEAIARIDKSHMIQTNQELFEKLLEHEFLLLNASLTLGNTSVSLSSQQWLPFLKTLFPVLCQNRPRPMLILLGNIAKNAADKINTKAFPKVVAEHPYNLSFISNPDVIKLFKSFQLLSKSTGAA
jgi:uracil-DNA glycosylase